MALRIAVVRYGREASVALRDHIAAAQADDPLAAVTVVVPSGYVGLSMRRLLASGDLGPAPDTDRTGIANVTFTTLPRLAERYGGPQLAAQSRRPLSNAMLHAAVRATLADDPGLFGPVQRHPTTETSLATLWRELRGADEATLRRLAEANDRAAELVRLTRGVTGRLAGWYDEHDLFDAALDALDDVDPPTELLVHLPGPLRLHQLSLVEAIGDRTPTTILLGASGDDEADTPARHLAERLGAEVRFPTGAVEPTEVLSAPSADVEALTALRTIMARHRDGTPLDRMAVVYGPAEPYARLLHERLVLDAIPFNGPGVRSLSHTAVGRTLLGALELPDRDWRRDDLVDWLSGAPVRSGPDLVPAVAWDRLSRAAGVTRGLDSWKVRLDRHRAEQAEKLETAQADDEVPEGRRRQLEREIATIDQITGFLDWLVRELEPATPPRRWVDWARWARRFTDATLGGPSHRDGWPLEEEQAVEEVSHALDRLSMLDEVEDNPDRATFLRALDGELSGSAPQTSRFGEGLLLGPVSTVVGLDLDLIVVVGMADGVFPARSGDDNLLPDDERAAAGDDIPLRSERAAELHRTYLAALAAAGERILSFPRGDIRSGREQRPSRWWLDGLAQATGTERTLYSRDLDGMHESDRYRPIPSHTAAVRAAGEPTGESDHDLRLLLHHHDRGRSPSDHWLARADPVLGAGLATRAARRSRAFTRFDGRIGPRPRRPEGPPAYSPTALETYATCPRRYLLGRVLRIGAPEKPERVLRIHPLDRGSLVHSVLEAFFARQTELDPTDRIRPDQAWTVGDHEVLDRIFDDEAAVYEETGRTGLRLLWEIDERAIRRDLHSFLDVDSEHRAGYRAVPEAVELPFGLDGGTPVGITLPDGREVHFRGYIDRLDLTASGGAVVRDYKSASATAYQAILDDPVDRGKRLQPAVYGLAARRHLGADDAAVDTGFWFTVERSNFESVAIILDNEAIKRFEGVVEILLDGIEGGNFPARPGERGRAGNCQWCDYKRLCPPSRHDEWERVTSADLLGRYVDLTEGSGNPGPGSDAAPDSDDRQAP